MTTYDRIIADTQANRFACALLRRSLDPAPIMHFHFPEYSIEELEPALDRMSEEIAANMVAQIVAGAKAWSHAHQPRIIRDAVPGVDAIRITHAGSTYYAAHVHGSKFCERDYQDGSLVIFDSLDELCNCMV